MDTIKIVEMAVVGFSLLISFICFYYTFKTKRRYEKLALRLGNNTDISVMLKSYIDKVNEIEKKDDQIIEYCNNINQELLKTIKKIGLVRYNSYGNKKNKLSFALALLNNENSGIVLNSVYGEDSSNIYAKPIINGKSKYNLSEEEIDAIGEAINNNLINIKK